MAIYFRFLMSWFVLTATLTLSTVMVLVYFQFTNSGIVNAERWVVASVIFVCLILASWIMTLANDSPFNNKEALDALPKLRGWGLARLNIFFDLILVLGVYGYTDMLVGAGIQEWLAVFVLASLFGFVCALGISLFAQEENGG